MGSQTVYDENGKVVTSAAKPVVYDEDGKVVTPPLYGPSQYGDPQHREVAAGGKQLVPLDPNRPDKYGGPGDAMLKAPYLGYVTPEQAYGIVRMVPPVVGAIKSAPTMIGKVAAGGAAVASQAAPQIKYELIKSGLQALHVPPLVAMPIAMIASGYRSGGKAKVAAEAELSPATQSSLRTIKDESSLSPIANRATLPQPPKVDMRGPTTPYPPPVPPPTRQLPPTEPNPNTAMNRFNLQENTSRPDIHAEARAAVLKALETPSAPRPKPSIKIPDAPTREMPISDLERGKLQEQFRTRSTERILKNTVDRTRASDPLGFDPANLRRPDVPAPPAPTPPTPPAPRESSAFEKFMRNKVLTVPPQNRRELSQQELSFFDEGRVNGKKAKDLFAAIFEVRKRGGQ